MQSTFRARGVYSQQTPEQVKARERMAEFPTGAEVEVLRVEREKWVPVVRVKGKVSVNYRGLALSSTDVLVDAHVILTHPHLPTHPQLCILPGIPSLFESLILSLTPYLPLPPSSAKPFRHLIFTEMPESSIAPFLTRLSERVRKEGIRIGSYPMLYR
jgi:molybdopterin-biosynthesis enzyme MoeA-like protein